MTLKSQLFADDAKLELAAVSNPAHIFRGAVGQHVSKIQKALIRLDNASINKAELTSKLFGETTEKAVLAYKQKRQIVNRSYQKEADAIVGVMTMAYLDKEMLQFESSVKEIAVLSAIACDSGYASALACNVDSEDYPSFIYDDQPLRDLLKVLLAQNEGT